MTQNVTLIRWNLMKEARQPTVVRSLTDCWSPAEAANARFRYDAASVRQSLQAAMADVCETDVMLNYHGDFLKSDRKSPRYPYCVVWTPIPMLS